MRVRERERDLHFGWLGAFGTANRKFIAENSNTRKAVAKSLYAKFIQMKYALNICMTMASWNKQCNHNRMDSKVSRFPPQQVARYLSFVSRLETFGNSCFCCCYFILITYCYGTLDFTIQRHLFVVDIRVISIRIGTNIVYILHLIPDTQKHVFESLKSRRMWMTSAVPWQHLEWLLSRNHQPSSSSQ